MGAQPSLRLQLYRLACRARPGGDEQHVPAPRPRRRLNPPDDPRLDFGERRPEILDALDVIPERAELCAAQAELIAGHQQVAEAMETLYRDGLPEYYEDLAYHYERSAADEKAVEYLLRAGEKAQRAYANEAAIGHFQRALERLSGSPLGEARKDWRLAALKELGVIYHGIGIEPTMLGKIFDPFQRVVEARHYGGLGLGLHIAKTIIDGLGGTIAVDSRLGAGTTFTVELPVSRSVADGKPVDPGGG